MDHPAFVQGRGAVITGGASGIGLATARRLASANMRVCLVDLSDALEAAAADLKSAGASEVMTARIDVSDANAVTALSRKVLDRFGDLALLMNNAGTHGGGRPFENPDGWKRVLDTNLTGVVNGIQAFAPAMIKQAQPSVIVNTGSKQGITCPPGDLAYNVSKAGVKTLTEGLAHSLREIEGCKVTAHLLIPGFTYTGMMRRHFATKPDAAWEPSQVVDALFAGLARGSFYILCEDNETPRRLDEKRILWAAEDIIRDRPALSRWHPEFKSAFAAFIESDQRE
jgi:NAD(P)-dependent dehydrogenase (short-subunit alcohol dehydrogenase family)